MPVLEDCVQVISCTVNYTRHDVSCMRTHLGVCPLHSQPEGLELLGAHLLHVGHQVNILLPDPLRPAQLPFRFILVFQRFVFHFFPVSCTLRLRGRDNRPGTHQCGLGGAGLLMAVHASKTLRVYSSHSASGVCLPLSTWQATEGTLQLVSQRHAHVLMKLGRLASTHLEGE
jgi:hypothetical protein